MAPDSAQAVEALVIRVQDDFLTSPTLKLSAHEAQQRFRIDGATCEAILGALVEAHVLARTGDGTYARFFPRLSRAA